MGIIFLLHILIVNIMYIIYYIEFLEIYKNSFLLLSLEDLY